jgi:molecular chaperone Hsp33
MADDFLTRFLFSNEEVRGAHVNMSHSVKAIMDQHQYPAPIRRILGECLVACTLLAHSIKIPGELSIELRSKSKIKLLVAKSSHQLEVRGLAQWDNDVEFDDLADVMREGDLVVTMMPDNGVQPLQSIVSLQGGDIATAFEHYFFQSEQLPTALRLQVSEDSATGLLLQQMPQTACTQDTWSYYTALLHTTSNEDFELDTSQLIQILLPEHDIELFNAHPVCFQCHCSRERMENAIRTVGQRETEDIIQERGFLEIRCEYCNQSYQFSKEDTDAIFN